MGPIRGACFQGLSLALLLALPAAADFADGWEAFKKGDYATAVKEWKPVAERGDTKAQLSLAAMYSNGQGVAQDQEEAGRWYRRAAVLGDSDAQFALALRYWNGEGVERDDKEAVRWFRLAAGQGDPEAQLRVGLCYRSGIGTTQDHVLALMWLTLAGRHGEKRATGIATTLAAEMFPAEVAEAIRLADRWTRERTLTGSR
jgi:uncharacterized protein